MRQAIVSVFLLFGLFLNNASWAADNDKELRQQRREAQQQRKAEVKERSNQVRQARRDLKDTFRELQAETREQVRELKTAFDLQRVDLLSARDGRIAEAEAEFTKKLQSSLRSGDGEEQMQQNLARLQEQAQAYARELFQLKKQAAADVHQAEMDNLRQQHELLDELDERVLQEAESLGLTSEYSPVLAQAIGGELTSAEQRWNERERKNVTKLMEQNARQLAAYRRGAALRQWERDNRDEDFELEWQEKEELNALQAMNSFYSLFMLQGGGAQSDGGQDLMSRLAEAQKERELIRIKYKKIRDQNNIRRREERRKLKES